MPRPKGPRKSHGRPTAAVDLVARNRLVEAHMDLVHEIAKGIAATSAGSKIDLADLFGEGAFGLLQAAQTFEPKEGFLSRPSLGVGSRERYSTESASITGSQSAPTSDCGARQRSELAATQRTGPAAGASLDVAEVDETERDAWWNGRRFVQPAAVQDDQLEALTKAEIERLPERDRRLLHLCYREDRSLSDAAQKLRFGRSWACRKHMLVLTTIRKVLEKRAPEASGSVGRRRRGRLKAATLRADEGRSGHELQ